VYFNVYFILSIQKKLSGQTVYSCHGPIGHDSVMVRW